MWHCGVMSVALIILRRLMNPLCISVSSLLLNEVTRVEFVLTSTMTMIFFIRVGNGMGSGHFALSTFCSLLHIL